MRGDTTCRVLFVEDEAMISMLIEDMLLDLGVEVVGPASKMADALALAREADIEAAILDINLGGQLTYPVAEVLKERGIPVIFATGYQPAHIASRHKNRRVLEKPYDATALVQALVDIGSRSACDTRIHPHLQL